MAKDEKKDSSSKAVAAPKSTKKLEASKPELPPEPVSETTVEVEASEEPKTLPRLRLRVEEETDKVKQFATAQGLSMHLKVTKAKRAGLGALHKMATWLTPKKK